MDDKLKMPLKISKIIPLLVFSLTISSCLPQESRIVREDPPAPKEETVWTEPELDPDLDTGFYDTDEAAAGSATKEQDYIRKGSGSFIKPSRSTSGSQASDGEITLNFESVDLREVVKVVFEEILNENYLIDPGVTGTVTIHTSKPISMDAVIPIFESILEVNGALLVRAGSVYKILPSAKLKGEVSAPTTGSSAAASAAGHGVQIIPLKYIAAAEMQKMLTSIALDENSVKVDEARNLLIVSGSYSKIRQIMNTVEMFDVDWLKGMSLALFRLQFSDAKMLVDELSNIIGSDGKGPLGGVVRLIPVERINAVLVITHQPGYINEARRLIEQFDMGTDQSPGQRLYVYKLKNAKATSIADILQQIFGQQQGQDEQGGSAKTSLESRQMSNISLPTQTVLNRNTAQQSTNSAAQKALPKDKQKTPTQSAAQDEVGTTDYPVTIIADEDNNAILVLATAQDYRAIKSTIRRLDVSARQVLIEATIAEVQLSDGLSHGVRWFFTSSARNNSSIRGGLNTPLPETVSGEGFTLGIFNSMGDLRFFFDLLEEESSVKFLSAPQIMVVDNQTASFNVGTQIPITTRSSQSTTDPNAPIVNEQQYRDTGTLLQVTPRINEGGMVTLEISQEVSVPGASADGSNPAISQRNINSTVIVQSGQTVVLGGLITESETTGKSGIPLLMDIPLVGNLFSSTTKDLSRNELIVTLTPRVVTNPKEAFELTRELKSKLNNASSFTGTGLTLKP